MRSGVAEYKRKKARPDQGLSYAVSDIDYDCEILIVRNGRTGRIH